MSGWPTGVQHMCGKPFILVSFVLVFFAHGVKADH